MDERELDALTHDYGREIFARLDAERHLFLTPAWLDERLMGWTMNDPALKVQLFRFVDVLPMLRAPADITRHLREYFAEAGPERVPAWLRAVLFALPSNGAAGRLLAFTARKSAQRMARRFIAGTT